MRDRSARLGRRPSGTEAGMIQDNDRPPTEDEGDVLDIGQAAVRLGISPDAVRKRIRRSRLRAYKVDGAWRVVLPSVSSVPSAAANVSSRTDDRTGLDTARDAGFLRLLRENERLLTLTEDQAVTLREQAQTIEAQRQTIAELTARLLGTERPRPEPPADSPVEAPERPVAPRRSWGWLRRLLGR